MLSIRRTARSMTAVVALGLWASCNVLIGNELPERREQQSDASQISSGIGGAGTGSNQSGGAGGVGGVDLCMEITCPIQYGCHGGCDPTTGMCAVPNGTPCDDGDACTQGDTCNDGICNSLSNQAWAHWYVKQADYIIAEKTVVDRVTGRMWQRETPTDLYDWQGALDYCSKLSMPGAQTGWRLPTRIELLSIVDFSSKEPAIDSISFPNAPPETFWSSSPYSNGVDQAWVVYFGDGGVTPGFKVEPYRVRCVRSIGS